MTEPTLRKPFGVLLILTLIAVWAFVIIGLSDLIVALHWSLQAIFFTIAGIAWILPLKPLLRCMETGKFR